MRGVTFGNKHSYWDWSLVLKSPPVVSPPEPKLKLVEIPGTDNVIDLTQTLTGKVHYKQRRITTHFILPCERERWGAIYTDILNYLQGQLLEIILDEDNEYAYTGRAKITTWNPEQHYVDVTITADVNPYKTARFLAGKQVL